MSYWCDVLTGGTGNTFLTSTVDNIDTTDNGCAGEEVSGLFTVLVLSPGSSVLLPYFWKFHMYMWRGLLLLHIRNLIFVRA